MKLTAKQYAQAFHQAILESRPEDEDKVLNNFVSILKERGDLGLLDDIEEEFHQYDRQSKGIQMGQITSARELSKTDEHHIIKQLNDYVGGHVELKAKVDEGLVGGVVIKLGDQLIDGSVKKSLADLKNELIK